MAPPPVYDHELIAQLRAEGRSWHDIAGHLDGDPKQLRQAHWKWNKARKSEGVEERDGGYVVQKWLRTKEGTIHVKMPKPGVTSENIVDEIWRDMREDFEDWQPRREAPTVIVPSGEPMLAVPNLYDPHFGMKAWGSEVDGPSQDLTIISEDFERAAEQLVGMSRIYPVERYLVPLGHDLSHVNQYDGKTATTRAGTVQDVDTRIAKIFTAIRRSTVLLVDMLRATGKPVDVIMVPGNHDPDENYKLGEVLQAWFRHDPAVEVTNTPTMHKYYGWGRNSLMLTHGEHYLKKNAGNPILTFATECPIDIWALSDGEGGCREILSGHFHKRMQGRYTPTSDVDEERQIVTRSLPGLTATDAWHYQQGYKHRRAATLLVYRKSGGVHGLHEVKP